MVGFATQDSTKTITAKYLKVDFVYFLVIDNLPDTTVSELS